MPFWSGGAPGHGSSRNPNPFYFSFSMEKQMNMKLKFIAAAVMALGAGSSFAATSVSCDTTSPVNAVNTCVPDGTLYIAGSSALGNAIKTVVPADVFEGTYTKVKADASVPNASATSAWFGVGKAGSAWAGKNVFVVYNNQNGSAAGVSQLLSSAVKDTTIPEADVVIMGPLDAKGNAATTQAKAVTANTCTLGSDGTETVNGVTYSFHQVTCTTHARTQADMALSDVAPAELFKLEGVKPAALTTVVGTPIAVQGFGVAVNANLYNKLQAVQIADGRLSSSCTAGDLTAACQPSIRRADYAALVTVGGSIKSAAALVGDAADTTKLILSRRDDLSGTQATSNMFFADNACGVSKDSKGKAIKGVLGGALDILGSPVPATIVNPVYSVAGVLDVNANATGGGVKSDLGNQTDYVIGVIGLGDMEPARTATSWKYVKLDGQSPNFNPDGTAAYKQRTAFANGDYPLAVSSYVVEYAAAKLPKTSVLKTFPALADAIKNGLKDSSLHDLAGIGYTDLPTAVEALSSQKETHYNHTNGNNCSPLLKM